MSNYDTAMKLAAEANALMKRNQEIGAAGHSSDKATTVLTRVNELRNMLDEAKELRAVINIALVNADQAVESITEQLGCTASSGLHDLIQQSK